MHQESEHDREEELNEDMDADPDRSRKRGSVHGGVDPPPVHQGNKSANAIVPAENTSKVNAMVSQFEPSAINPNAPLSPNPVRDTKSPKMGTSSAADDISNSNLAGSREERRPSQ